MSKFCVVLKNHLDCEIDYRTVDTAEEINGAVADIALNCILSPGDKIIISEID